MWLRTAEVSAAPDAVLFRHEAASSGPECRLRAALLRWDAAGGFPEARIAGAAWASGEGIILWGWPDESGRFELRPGPDGAETGCVLPPAISLALALGRAGPELGARVLVIGDGFLGRIARAVALASGCRVQEVAGPIGQEADQGSRPDIVIETTGDPRSLDWAASRCSDWGTIYSTGGGLTAGPLNYYDHVHRRALTVTQVPESPVLRPHEREIVERGAVRLAQAVRGVVPSEDEAMRARVLPEGVFGRLTRESSGWGLFRVGES